MFLNILEILKSRIVKKTIQLQYANYNFKKRCMPDFQLKNKNIFYSVYSSFNNNIFRM